MTLDIAAIKARAKATEWLRYLREKKSLLSTTPAEARNFEAIAQLIEASETARVKAEQERDAETAAFKNFHRMLCERFDCHVHDEIDWKRDQVSLMEWIAKRITDAEGAPDQSR